MTSSSESWCIDMDSVPPAHRWFALKVSPGLTFDVGSPPHPLELAESFVDDEPVYSVVTVTNQHAVDMMNSSRLSNHSGYKTWGSVTRNCSRVCFCFSLSNTKVPTSTEVLVKHSLIATPVFREILSVNPSILCENVTLRRQLQH